MHLNVPNPAFVVTHQTGDDGITSIHIGNVDAGPVAELILHPGQHVEVSRDPFVHQHIPGFGAEELSTGPTQGIPTPVTHVGPTLSDFFKYSPEWAGVVATDSEWATLLMESVLEVSGGDVHYAAGLDKTRHAFNMFLTHDSGMRGERADRFASALRDAAVAFGKRMATGDMVPAQQAEPEQTPTPSYDGLGRFRKKPVVIEAIQFDGTANGAKRIQAAFPDHQIEAEVKSIGCLWPEPGWSPPAKLYIPTLEGGMTAGKGDWIIRGVKGEVYPCKPDIFAATYDAVT